VTTPNAVPVGTGRLTCAGGTAQLDLTGKPAGLYTVVVTAVDNGVSSADLDAADVLTLTYTLYPPIPTMLSGSPDQSGVADTNNAGRTPAWSVQLADPNATLICAVSGPTSTSATQCVTGTGGISLNLAGLSAGTYTVTVTALDNGVKSSDLAAGDVLTLTYRLVPATPTLVAGAADQAGIAGANNSGRSASWSVTDGDSGASLSCAVIGPSGSTLLVATQCTTGNGGVRLDLTNQPAGTYTIVVTAIDAGVSSNGSVVLTYTMSPAAATVIGPASRTGAGRTPTWTVTDSDAGVSSYTCTVIGPAGSSPTVD
jgi:hypothetical protein